MTTPLPPDITAQGNDGSVFRYYAIRGPQYPPEQVGWVLAIENVKPAIDPQALTAGEVLGDLVSMTVSADHARGSVQFFTEQMIDALEAQSEQLVAAGDDPSGHRTRADKLRSELRDAVS